MYRLAGDAQQRHPSSSLVAIIWGVSTDRLDHRRHRESCRLARRRLGVRAVTDLGRALPDRYARIRWWGRAQLRFRRMCGWREPRRLDAAGQSRRGRGHEGVESTPTVRNRIRKQMADAIGSTFVMVLVFFAARSVHAGLPFLFDVHPSIRDGYRVRPDWRRHPGGAVRNPGQVAIQRIRRIWTKLGTWTHRWRMQQLAIENRLNYIPTSGGLSAHRAPFSPTPSRGHWDTFRVLGDRFEDVRQRITRTEAAARIVPRTAGASSPCASMRTCRTCCLIPRDRAFTPAQHIFFNLTRRAGR